MSFQNPLFRFLFSLLVGILIIAFFTSAVFLHFSERHVHNYRRRHMINMASQIEQKIKSGDIFPLQDDLILKELNLTNKEFENQGEIPYPFSFLKKQNNLNQSRIINEVPDGKLWLVSKDGTILSSASSNRFNFEWEKDNLPILPHELRSLKSWLKSSYFILKLNTSRDIYFVLKEDLPYFDLNYISLILGHSFVNTSMAMLLALVIIFYYLKKKSQVAARVMSQLESGNLKARFEIGRFEEFTNLLCDFNRMADEIERLVLRLKNAESARTQMIQELGHDLKTPLTSMMTNTETLAGHFDRINPAVRNDLINQLKSDIIYFKNLIESLTEVAFLDRPSNKFSQMPFDVETYLAEEISRRQFNSNLIWSLEIEGRVNTIGADQHLITRLFKNAFDNSSRYAKSKVFVKIISGKETIKIFIMDDGPGLSECDLQLFGKRRERRKRREGSEDYSLGFGSMIMKSIVERHGGNIEISNLLVSDKIVGSRLEITLPVLDRNHKQVEKTDLSVC